MDDSWLMQALGAHQHTLHSLPRAILLTTIVYFYNSLLPFLLKILI